MASSAVNAKLIRHTQKQFLPRYNFKNAPVTPLVSNFIVLGLFHPENNQITGCTIFLGVALVTPLLPCSRNDDTLTLRLIKTNYNTYNYELCISRLFGISLFLVFSFFGFFVFWLFSFLVTVCFSNRFTSVFFPLPSFWLSFVRQTKWLDLFFVQIHYFMMVKGLLMPFLLWWIFNKTLVILNLLFVTITLKYCAMNEFIWIFRRLEIIVIIAILITYRIFSVGHYPLIIYLWDKL